MKKLHLIVSLLALFGSASVSALNGSPIVVANGSFENPTPNSGTYFFAPGANQGVTSITQAVPDWTYVNTGSVSGVSTGAGAVPGSDGSQYTFANAGSGSPASTITYSGTGVDALPLITANTKYTLTVALGNNTTGTTADPGTYYLNFLAGGTPIPGAVSGPILQINSVIPQGTFKDFSVTLTAAEASSFIGQQLGIQLESGAYSGSNFTQTIFDNVRLSETSTVPEPSTWALIGVGALALVWQAKRKRLV
jgi:hypothetical protein